MRNIKNGENISNWAYVARLMATPLHMSRGIMRVMHKQMKIYLAGIMVNHIRALCPDDD